MIADEPATDPVEVEAADVPQDYGAGSERYKQRGVMLRVLVYVVVGHLFAGFLWLLFYVGAHSHR